jgi:phosphate transport system substrate-binding protein
MRMPRTLGALATLTLVATLAGTALAEVNLTGAGATFPYPLYSKWFDVYQKETGVKINYQSIGSGAGIQQVKAGTVDFGASDAALSNQRLKEMPRAVLHFPTAAGAVVLAYNMDGVSQPLNLTSDIIAGIYLGKVTQWNDKAIAAVNPGVALPPSPILAVHRSDGSGTTNIFTTYLSVVSRSWKELVGANTSVSWPVGIGGKGNEGVAGLVRQTPGSIGYVELAYAKQNHLAYAHVRNAAGKFIEPTLASTTAAAQGAAAMLAKDVRTPIANSSSPDAYPIAGMTFLLVYKDQKDADKGKALADFIRWANSKGQEINETLEYARLPEPVVKVNEATLMQLRVAGRPIASAQ